MEKSPKNLIVLPVLKPKIASDKAYILKSFAYKIINFSQDAQPYELVGLSKSALYMGFDVSHEHQKRQSHYAFSAVDSASQILYLNQVQELPLNERIDLQTLQQDIVRSINAYQTKYKEAPKRILLMRDGLFLEDKDLLKNHLELLDIEYAVVEINKNSEINSESNLKSFLIQLEPARFIYFSQTYNLQKAVEINIVFNKTAFTNEQLAKEIYLTTRLYHPTPYTNLKLPYPLHVTDKVALYKKEWKLYVPYFVIL